MRIKNSIFIFPFLMLICGVTNAQPLTRVVVKEIIPTDSGVDSIHQSMLQNDSVYKKRNDDFEKLMASKKAAKKKQSLTIPLVIHVLQNGDKVLTDLQIRKSIAKINKKLPDMQFLIASTKGKVGIVRHNISSKRYGKKGLTISKKGVKGELISKSINWDFKKYCNVYIVNKINNQDCSAPVYDIGYVNYDSSPSAKLNGAIVIHCSFLNEENSVRFFSELGSFYKYYSSTNNERKTFSFTFRTHH